MGYSSRLLQRLIMQRDRSKSRNVSSTLEELSPADDELQFTALCRVLPANVHVADETMQRVQFYQRNQETVYAPQREEYMVCRASHVMPEFLIAFRVEQPEGNFRVSCDIVICR